MIKSLQIKMYGMFYKLSLGENSVRSKKKYKTNATES